MDFYHVILTICMTFQGGSQQCGPDKMIDTRLHGLVRCYSVSKEVEAMSISSIRQEASKENAELAEVEVRTRCVTLREGEAFLKEAGPSALIISGKQYD